MGEVLIFSYVGLKTVERTIENENTINVSMEESVAVLDGVVVIAYGEQDRKKLV